MTSDPLDLQGIDYVEFYVLNALQAAHFYRTALGLRPVAYAGLETGVRDRASWALARRNIRFVLTAPLLPDPRDPIAAHIARHGDGVKDIALRVADAVAAYREALRRGARSVQEPIIAEVHAWPGCARQYRHLRRHDPQLRSARGRQQGCLRGCVSAGLSADRQSHAHARNRHRSDRPYRRQC